MDPTLDIVKMRQIAEESYVVSIGHAFGDEGTSALRVLMDILTQIYRAFDPALRTKILGVFIRVHASEAPPGEVHAAIPLCEIAGPDHIQHELDDACLVEVTHAGRLKVYDSTAYDLRRLSEVALVYLYKERTEWFVIAGTQRNITNPSRAHASIFARPTFSSLDEALQNYRGRVVHDSSCYILEDAWSDTKRLFFRPGPEEVMRRSLQQFLRNTFPNAEVRPEQVVDESHPVDIKVTWSDTNQRALIEIKWLGKAREENGHVTVAYTDVRARDGAKQLADYLDSNKTAGPGLRTYGYLVVYDARRRGLNGASSSINADNGLYYRDREITYNPDYHKIRTDFAPPLRMFAEPVLN